MACFIIMVLTTSLSFQDEPDAARKGTNWKYSESGETLSTSSFCLNLHITYVHMYIYIDM